VKLEAVGLAQAVGGLERLARRAANLEPVFRGPIDREVLAFGRAQFDTAGRAGGVPWRALSASTIAQKRKLRRDGMGILRRFNRLFASVTKRTGPDALVVITPQRYERGTRVPYALPLVSGTRRGIPARPIYPANLPPALLTRFATLVARHLEARDAG
jgi:hypothetical protein